MRSGEAPRDDRDDSVPAGEPAPAAGEDGMTRGGTAPPDRDLLPGAGEEEPGVPGPAPVRERGRGSARGERSRARAGAGAGGYARPSASYSRR
jgi:hypothetical protein